MSDPRRHGDGSITAVGTDMQSYYGRPIVKEPTWKAEIPVYFFTGGIAGAGAVLHGYARLAGHERLARTSLLVAGACDVVNPLLLIADLGRPERFLNMLRMFKVTSPMSVGSWILSVQSGASITAAALELAGVLAPLKKVSAGVAFLLGPPLATYTGALVANSAIPVWSEARDELPPLFAASASASAGAASALFLRPSEAAPARRLALAGVATELAIMRVMEQRLGFVGEVYKQGTAGKLARATKLCATTGAGLLAWNGKRSRAALVGGSGLILAGELALRFSVYKAGFQSARDPRYTVLPQRERLRRKRAAEAVSPVSPAA